MVIWIYRILYPVLSLLLAPYYLRRMIRRGGYGRKVSYRIGLWPKLPPKKKGVRRIWIQAVSVGELSSIGKLLENLLANPKVEIVLSGTTSTGLSIAEEKYGGKILAQGPFPLDWLPFSKLAWSRIRPDMALTVDSELWPEHMRQTKTYGVPFAVINARLSDRSLGRLQFLRFLHGLLLPPHIRILASSEKQQERWTGLGLGSGQVRVTGNLKVDAIPDLPSGEQGKEELLAELGFSTDSLVIAGISTWPGEEEALLSSVESLRKEGLDARLLLVPRHAERREEISATLTASGLSFNLRTRKRKAEPGTIVYLADTTGELFRLIRVADLAFIGKTLPPNGGGQNPIEPVSLGIPLVIGPAYQNFRETCSELFSQEAALKARDTKETLEMIRKLALNEELRRSTSSAGKAWIAKQGSPTETTLDILADLLEET